MEPVWYLKKAKERLDTAEWALEKGYMNSVVSNCYYASFNAMQAVLEEGRWRHGGVAEKFCEKVYTTPGLAPLKGHIKGLTKKIKRLYTLRKLSDYEGFVGIEEKEEVESLVSFAKELIMTVESLIEEES